MNRLHDIAQFGIELLIGVILGTFAVHLLTGCTTTVKLPAATKTVVSAALKDAYAYGGATAVSNRIEQLVVDGKITPEQAIQLHALAQGVYERIINRLDKEIGVADDCGDACSEAVLSTEK
ncbi:MAG: hypothetical protein ACI4RA_10810 [Kiritimatiellia bacterium]